MMLCSLSPPPSCPSGMAVPVPCLPAPSADRAPTLPPCPGSGCPGGAGLSGLCRPQGRGRPWQQLRRGGEGGSRGCGKYILGRQRGRETFSRKKLLQFSPYIPSCEWLGRGLSAGLASPSAFPPAADTSGKWESDRDSFNRTLLTSTCPSLPPPGNQKGVQNPHANTSPGVV